MSHRREYKVRAGKVFVTTEEELKPGDIQSQIDLLEAKIVQHIRAIDDGSRRVAELEAEKRELTKALDGLK